MRRPTREEIIEYRNKSGMGLEHAAHYLKTKVAIEAVEMATTVEELKPVLLFLLGE